MTVAALLAAFLLLLTGGATASAGPAALDARARVEHHLAEAEGIVRHLETVLREDCPRFTSPEEWRAYLGAEVDRVVLMVAHLEQAWVEAKRTGDDDVRRTAKAPRKELHQAEALVDKLQACADANGASFAPATLWRRIEREVPRRQAEIALPE
ncbi:MAG: hypothetical protein HY727_14885 [Candidatus Rokubacteria bacterium]|nr:hypothetical protein [Candidatus Rokubacteria bacterium]